MHVKEFKYPYDIETNANELGRIIKIWFTW